MDTVPWHSTGKRQERLHKVQERSMPVVFEEAPAALDRLVLTLVRRGRGQPHTYVIAVPNLDQPLPTLCAPTMLRWAMIQMHDQGGNVRQALPPRLPPLDEPI